MDSQTHIELADKLLQCAGAPRSLAICSLFPQIDRRPPTLHRLYAHTLFKARAITDLGIRVLFAGSIDEHEQDYFAYRRFKEEQSRLTGYLGLIQGEGTLSFHGENPQLGLLSFVSHLYLDTYNQPTQAFAPLSVYPSGQWDLWKRLGDFRLKLYTTETINHLRKALFASPLWSEVSALTPSSLIQAMLFRMAGASLAEIQDDVINQAMRSLEIEASSQETRKASEFLIEFENRLSYLHEKFLPTALSAQALPSASLANN